MKEDGVEQSGVLAGLNQSIRASAQNAAPDWLLRNQMRVNSALGLAGFMANFMASGAGNKSLRTNPYRAALLPAGLTAMGIGIAFDEPVLSEEDRAHRKEMPLAEHLKLSLREAIDPIHYPLRANGLIGIGISGLLLGSYRFEHSRAFWGELSAACAAGVAGSAMLLARDPATSWQLRSAAYLAGTPPEAVANWNLMQSPDGDASMKGRWMFTKTALAGTAHVMGYLLGGASPQPGAEVSEANSVGKMGAEHAISVAR